jgi:hypothetical protein
MGGIGDVMLPARPTFSRWRGTFIVSGGFLLIEQNSTEWYRYCALKYATLPAEASSLSNDVVPRARP